MRSVYSIEGRLLTGTAPAGASMGILVYLKIAAIVVALGVGAYFAGTYVHDHDLIKEQKLQDIADTMKAQNTILEAINANQQAFLTKKNIINVQVKKNENESQAAVDSGDVQRVIDMFHKLRPANPVNPPANGIGGRAKLAPAAPAQP